LAKRRPFLAVVRGIPPTVWVPTGAGLLALGICCYQLSLPFVLLGIHGYTGNGYDDGVYLGAATRLVHGVLPYRDFDFLQPPGITLVMGPVALLGRLIGTRDAMAVARCLTALVMGFNAALAALVVRYLGKTAMLIAGISLALFPLAVAADQSLLLEPYLVCFCLLGVLAIFSGGEMAGPRRVLLAGLAFGFAGSIKLWAVLPAAAALVCCLPAWRRGLRPLGFGMLLGFALPCLPFFAFAPHGFVHDVFTAQIHRGTSGRGALSIAQRLVMISGVSGLPGLNATTGMAVVLFVVFAALVAAVYLTSWRTMPRLEWFVLLSVVVVFLGMFSSPEFYDHYAYFPAAFLALLLAVCVRRSLAWARQLVARSGKRRVRALATVTSIVVVGAIAVTLVLVIGQDTSYAASYLSSSADPSAAVDAVIPEGSCVVFDYAIFAINANRFNPAGTGCPAVIDSFGMWLTRDNGQPPPAAPPFPSAFSAAWQGWLGQADYVVLSIPLSDYVPWTPQLEAFFNEHFLLASSEPRTFVYNHFDRVPAGTANTLVQRALAALGHGQPDEARADFESVLAIDPADTDASFDLGVLDQRQHRGAAAAAAYEQALFLDPRFTPALFNLAVLDTPASPGVAINLYRRILRIKPADVDTEFNLGLLLVKSGQRTEGEQLLNGAVRSDPSLAARLPAGIASP